MGPSVLADECNNDEIRRRRNITIAKSHSSEEWGTSVAVNEIEGRESVGRICTLETLANKLNGNDRNSINNGSSSKALQHFIARNQHRSNHLVSFLKLIWFFLLAVPCLIFGTFVGFCEDIFEFVRAFCYGSRKDTEPPYLTAVATQAGWLILTLFGHVRDFFGRRFYKDYYAHLLVQNGYAPLIENFEAFYTRNMYKRIRDCWNRPITGVPGRTITLLERYSEDFNDTFKFTGRHVKVLNLASYNYLGFAQNEGPCVDAVVKTIESYGVGVGSSRAEVGTLDLHQQLEEQVARFVGKEAALVFGMGFATNSTMIPALVEPGCLIISDELNHTSLIYGCRVSGVKVRRFEHNDMKSLEEILRNAFEQGMPPTRRPWKRILVIVEGLYSMEGSLCDLPGIMALKKKYKFHLFIDEAHSIGVMGSHGRGVCDFFNIDPAEVDILMGTFTKSFGAAGGYIAGSHDLIAKLKQTGHGYIYSEPITPPIVQQIMTSLRIISGEDGTNEGQRRLQQIHGNSIYFMRELKKLGFIVYGDEGSPVVPLLIFQPGKIAAFSREALGRGLAVVVVGYPATALNTARVRFCISAAHTREDLDKALEKISEIGDVLGLKFS